MVRDGLGIAFSRGSGMIMRLRVGLPREKDWQCHKLD
jgi:hypothetical protein